MNIACLGWGSLIWDIKDLPVKGEWQDDGPMLPIEFARQSEDDRITLVIVPGKKPVRSLWSLLSSSSLLDAKEALCRREGISEKNIHVHIGAVERGEDISSDDIKKTIHDWMKPLEIDAVIWTALPPKFKGNDYVIPSKEQVVEHLNDLTGKAKLKSEKYVRKAPKQVITEYRSYIEKSLCWKRIIAADEKHN